MSLKGNQRLTEIKKIIVCSMLVAMMMLNTGFTHVSLPENLHQVTVNADGKTITFDTNRTNPQLLLAKAGVKLSAGDEYEMHKIDEARTEINVYRAVPVTITYQGQTYYPDLWQTGSDFKIDGISGYVDMNYKYD
jgi:uncharacterized protein YabE (DUF348 family)